MNRARAGVSAGLLALLAALVPAAGRVPVAAPAPSAVAAAPAPSKPAPSRPAPAAPRPALKVKSVSLMVFHRAFPDFRDLVTTRLKEEFRIGDTEFTGRILEFVPDFMLDMKTRKITSRSNEPRNPAVRVAVRRAGAPVDTSWAFVNTPPHFARRSLLAFVVRRIDFENHAPVVGPDTLGAPSHGPKP